MNHINSSIASSAVSGQKGEQRRSKRPRDFYDEQDLHSHSKRLKERIRKTNLAVISTNTDLYSAVVASLLLYIDMNHRYRQRIATQISSLEQQSLMATTPADKRFHVLRDLLQLFCQQRHMNASHGNSSTSHGHISPKDAEDGSTSAYIDNSPQGQTVQFIADFIGLEIRLVTSYIYEDTISVLPTCLLENEPLTIAYNDVTKQYSAIGKQMKDFNNEVGFHDRQLAATMKTYGGVVVPRRYNFIPVFSSTAFSLKTILNRNPLMTNYFQFPHMFSNFRPFEEDLAIRLRDLTYEQLRVNTVYYDQLLVGAYARRKSLANDAMTGGASSEPQSSIRELCESLRQLNYYPSYHEDILIQGLANVIQCAIVVFKSDAENGQVSVYPPAHGQHQPGLFDMVLLAKNQWSEHFDEVVVEVGSSGWKTLQSTISTRMDGSGIPQLAAMGLTDKNSKREKSKNYKNVRQKKMVITGSFEGTPPDPFDQSGSNKASDTESLTSSPSTKKNALKGKITKTKERLMTVFGKMKETSADGIHDTKHGWQLNPNDNVMIAVPMDKHRREFNPLATASAPPLVAASGVMAPSHYPKLPFDNVAPDLPLPYQQRPADNLPSHVTKNDSDMQGSFSNASYSQRIDSSPMIKTLSSPREDILDDNSRYIEVNRIRPSSETAENKAVQMDEDRKLSKLFSTVTLENINSEDDSDCDELVNNRAGGSEIVDKAQTFNQTVDSTTTNPEDMNNTSMCWSKTSGESDAHTYPRNTPIQHFHDEHIVSNNMPTVNIDSNETDSSKSRSRSSDHGALESITGAKGSVTGSTWTKQILENSGNDEKALVDPGRRVIDSSIKSFSQKQNNSDALSMSLAMYLSKAGISISQLLSSNGLDNQEKQLLSQLSRQAPLTDSEKDILNKLITELNDGAFNNTSTATPQQRDGASSYPSPYDLRPFQYRNVDTDTHISNNNNNNMNMNSVKYTASEIPPGRMAMSSILEENLIKMNCEIFDLNNISILIGTKVAERKQTRSEVKPGARPSDGAAPDENATQVVSAEHSKMFQSPHTNDIFHVLAHSIMFTAHQYRDAHALLQTRLRLDLPTSMSDHAPHAQRVIRRIQKLCTREWRRNKQRYSTYLRDIDFDSEVDGCRTTGDCCQQLENAAPLGVANSIGVEIQIITSLRDYPVLQVTPDKSNGKSEIVVLLLAFDQGAGLYGKYHVATSKDSLMMMGNSSTLLQRKPKTVTFSDTPEVRTFERSDAEKAELLEWQLERSKQKREKTNISQQGMLGSDHMPSNVEMPMVYGNQIISQMAAMAQQQQANIIPNTNMSQYMRHKQLNPNVAAVNVAAGMTGGQMQCPQAVSPYIFQPGGHSTLMSRPIVQPSGHQHISMLPLGGYIPSMFVPNAMVAMGSGDMNRFVDSSQSSFDNMAPPPITSSSGVKSRLNS